MLHPYRLTATFVNRQNGHPLFKMMHSLALFILLCFSSPATAQALDDDSWDWYTGMSPFEQCMDYLNGDPFIEEVTGEDLSSCGEIWGVE